MTSLNPRSEVRQRTDEGTKGKKSRSTYYGDVLKKKKSSKNLRVLFQNINGLGLTKENDKK